MRSVSRIISIGTVSVALNMFGLGFGAATPVLATTSSTLSAPSGVVASSGDSAISIAWTDPTTGTTPTSYDVFLGATSGGENYVTPACATISSSCLVTGLTDGTSYYLTVESEAGSLNSVPSSEVVAVPMVAPLAPTDPLATGDASALVVSWTAPTSGTTPQSYSVYVGTSSRGENYTSAGCSTTTTSCVVTGLQGTTQYFATVKSNYGSLQSAASGETFATTTDTPSTPNAPTATNVMNVAHGSSAEALVSWTAPANGNSPLTGYVIVASPSAVVPAACSSLLNGTSTQCLFSGLVPGTAYSFSVKATNGAGSSPPSPLSSPIVLSTVSVAPKRLVVTSTARGQATASWTPPVQAGTGGSNINGYTATAIDLTSPRSPSRSCTTTGATFCTVSNLVASNVYSFSVVAYNADGASLSSVPVAMPGSVTQSFARGSTLLSPKAKQALASYAADLYTGASLTITGYAPSDDYLAKSRAVTAGKFLESLVGHLKFQFHEVVASRSNAVTIVTVSNLTNSFASTVGFTKGSAVLTSSDQRTLLSAAQFVTSGDTVAIIGYALNNKALASARASAVATFLTAHLANVFYKVTEVTSATINIATFSVSLTT